MCLVLEDSRQPSHFHMVNMKVEIVSFQPVAISMKEKGNSYTLNRFL